MTYKNFIKTVNKIKLNHYFLKDNLDPDLISNYLNFLNFNYIYNEKKQDWLIFVPGYRTKQITRSVSIIQEISRVHGFDQFPAKLCNIKNSGQNDKTYKLKLISVSYTHLTLPTILLV